MNSKIKWLSIALFTIIIIISILGGKIFMDNKKFQHEMIEIVNGREAEEVFRESLAGLDSKAFTEEGIIKLYEIDDESIKHSPMGSILVNLILNNDKELVVKYDLNKRNGSLEYGGLGLSEKLSQKIEDRSNE